MVELSRAMDHDSQGCHEISQQAYPVADAYVKNVDGTPALVLPFPVPRIEFEDLYPLAESKEDDQIGVCVHPWKFSAKVARGEHTEQIFSLWLTEPELIGTVSSWDMEGSVTETDLNYLGA